MYGTRKTTDYICVLIYTYIIIWRINAIFIYPLMNL